MATPVGYTMPHFSIQDMTAALQFLKTWRLEPNHPLFSSEAVMRQYNTDPVRGYQRFLFHVADLLQTVLFEKYSHFRGLHGLPAPLQTSDYDATIAAIEQDATQPNPQLVAISILYHRYARTDLGIDGQSIVRMFNVSDRTCRRYQHDMLTELVQDILQLEAEAFEPEPSTHMQMLPAIAGSVADVATLSMVDTAQRCFTRRHVLHMQLISPSCFQQTAAAIALAQCLVREQLVHNVVFVKGDVDHADTLEEFAALARQRLALVDSYGSPVIQTARFIDRQLSKGRRTLIVLSNADGFRALLPEIQLAFKQCSLVVTASRAMPAWGATVIVPPQRQGQEAALQVDYTASIKC